MSECCGPATGQTLLNLVDETDIKAAVRARYTQVATGETSCCGSPADQSRAQRPRDYGYELSILGDEVPVSVLDSFAGCGNPLAIDTLERGEVVLDLGFRRRAGLLPGSQEGRPRGPGDRTRHDRCHAGEGARRIKRC